MSVFLSESDAADLFEDCNTITVTYTQDTVIDKCDWTVRRMYVIADACDNKTYDTIKVSGQNKVTLAMSPDTTICLGGTANLRSTATPCSGEPTYQWTSVSAGNGMPGTTTTNNISVMPTSIGDKIYADTAYDANGCKVVESITVHVNDTARLVASNTTQTVCAVSSITPIAIEYANATLTTESMPAGLTLTTHGDGKDTITGSITGALADEVYTFTIKAENGDCGDKQITCTITIDSKTETYDTVKGCGTYTWTSTANPSEDQTWDTPGEYDVVHGAAPNVYHNVDGCDSTHHLHVVVYDLPTPTMNNDTVCLGSDATLAVNETYAHYDWGNGVDRRDSTVTTTAVGETTYTVTVTDEHNCTAPVEGKIVVKDTVSLRVINGEQTLCLGQEMDTVKIIHYHCTVDSLAVPAGLTLDLTFNDSTAIITGTPTATYKDTVYGNSHEENVTCDQKSRIITITVNEPGDAGLPATATLCASSSGTNNSVTITSSLSIDDYNFTWTATGATPSSATDVNSVTLKYDTEGDYEVTVIAEDKTTHCLAYDTTKVTVNEVTIPVIAGRSTICEGETDTLTTTVDYAGYEWIGQGSDYDTLFVTTEGDYTVVGTDANGCSDTSAAFTVEFFPQTGLELIGNLNQTKCVGGSIDSVRVVATNASTVNVSVEPNTIDYTYNATTGNIGLTSAGDAVITVTVTAVDEHLCHDSTLTFKVTPSNRTEFDTTIAACGSVTWISANENITFTEDADTVFGIAPNPVYHDIGGCDSVTFLHVNVHADVTPIINGPANVCFGDTVFLSTADEYASYSWNDGKTTRLDTIGPATTGEQTYTVDVVTAEGCNGHATITVQIDTLPVPVINGDTVLCHGGSTTLTTTTAYDGYSWSSGTPDVSATGDYTVTVTDGNGCEGTSAAFHVEVLDEITVSENSADATYCPGDAADSLSFTAHGGHGGYSYQWQLSTDGGTNFNDISGATDTVYTPATDLAAGSYVYRVSVDDDMQCGPVEQVIATITIRTTITVSNAISAEQYCLNETATEIGVTPTGGSGNYTYQWAVSTDSVAYTNVSTDSSYTPTTTEAGTYYYRVTVSDEHCGDTTLHVQTVTVNPLVGLSLTPDSLNVCLNGTVNIGVTATNASSVTVEDLPAWATYDDGTHTITGTATSGDLITYKVTATSAYGCGDSVLYGKVKIGSLSEEIKTFAACESYHWHYDGDGYTEDTTYTASTDTAFFGPYPSANGCDSITRLHVTINPLPVPVITGDDRVCLGDTAFLSTTETYNSYVWSNTSTYATDTVVPATAGTTSYTVTVIDANGCEGISPVAFEVIADTLPVPVITGLDTICAGATATLSTTVDYATYDWSSGTPNVTETGDYTVTVTDGHTCSGTSAPFHVEVLDTLKVAENTPDGTYCLNQTDGLDTLKVTATGGDGHYHYTWEVSIDGGAYSTTGGDTNICVPTTTAAGEYTYRVTVGDEHNCGDSIVTVAVVTVRDALTVSENIGDSAYCLGATAYPVGVTATGGSGSYSYAWEVSTDNGTTYADAGTDSTLTPTTTPAGEYLYRVTVSDNVAACGSETVDVYSVTVWPQTGLELTGDLNQTKCIGGNIDSVKVTATNAASVTVSVEPNTIAYTYNETSGNIGLITAGNEGDVIDVTVTAIDPNSCHDSTLTFKVTLSSQTVKDSTITGCGSVAWTSAEHPEEDSTFTVSTVWQYGPYTAANGCDSVINLTVDVNGGTMPVFSLPEDVCVTASETNDSIEISVQALSGYTYEWNIDGGIYAISSPHGVDGVSDTNIVVVRWTTEGDKSVSVTLTSLDNSCEGTDSKTIHVHAAPAISIAAVAGDICPYVGSQAVTATVEPASTADYTYTWGGGLTVTTDNATTDATTSEATATIPTSPCDTSYKVGVSVTDGNGCTATADSVTLTVRDVTAPTYDRPADTTIYKDATCSADITPEALGTVSNVVESCSPVVDTSYTDVDVTPATACMGTTVIERRWRVVDLCGNVSTSDSVQTITLLDTVAPVIAGTMTEVTVEGCDESAVPAVAATDTTVAYMISQGVTSVTDNCSDEAHLTISISDGAMTGDCDHQVIRTYTVTDDCGNSSSTTQTITITRPAFPLPAIDTITVVCEVDAVPPTPDTVTLCGTDYTAQPVNTGDTNRVSAIVDDTLYITYNYQYTDCKGSYDWHWTYKIKPGDFEPKDSVHIYVNCPCDVPDPIPTPQLTVCGEEIPFVFVDVSVSDTARCGDSIYHYTYEVNGQTYDWAYIVTFSPGDFVMPNDTIIPVSCPIAVQAPHENGLMPRVFNNCGHDISDNYTIVSQPDDIPSCEGEAVYVYRYEDCAGHSHEWTCTYIIEREDFTIAAEPGSALVVCADEALGAGEAGSLITLPTVMPACEGEAALVPTDTIPGDMPTCNGVMTYTYVYEDCAGHSHDWVFTYTVRDTVPPTITPIADRMADAGGGCEYVIPDLQGEVVATDNCGDIHFMGQTPAAGTRYQQQTTARPVEVIVQVDDDCENHSYDTVIITIPAKDATVSVTPTNPAVCQGGSIQLTANGSSSAVGTENYTWNPTNGLDATTGASVNASPSNTTMYTVTYTDGNGCSATATTTVTVNPLPTLNATNRDQEVCAGGSITNIIVNATYANVTVSNLPSGLTYNSATSTISGRPAASGTYTITATSIYGCDPVELTGTITVTDTVRNTTPATACDTYVWSVNNATYTQSGTYSVQNVAQDGCISVDVLNLTVNHRSYGVQEVDACDSYTWHGQTYTGSTNTPTYTIQGGNAAGCDSTVTLHLSVHNSSVSESSESVCDQYTWEGVTYTESTDIVQSLQSRYGCDSTVTLHLTIYPSYHFDTDTDSICQGDYYNYHGNIYNETGVYHVALRTRAGCDSIYSLSLTVLQPMAVSIADDFDCQEGGYTLTAVTESQYLHWSEYLDHGQLSAQDTARTIRVTPPETTTYTVTVGYGLELMCPSSESITLDEFVVPVAAIETRPNWLSIDHNHWYADDASTGETDGREWYVDGQLYTQQSQHIDGELMVNPFGDPDSVTLVLIVHSDKCADTAEAVIPLIWSEIWVPNVFTPSLDINNLFGAEGVGIIEIETWIFTREGLLVFHSESMEEKWDGKHQSTGTDCKQDAYTYRINYRFASKPEELQTKVGLVMLLR